MSKEGGRVLQSNIVISKLTVFPLIVASLLPCRVSHRLNLFSYSHNKFVVKKLKGQHSIVFKLNKSYSKG